jgi:uncharacterized protein
MSIELEDRGKALEDEFFHRQEKELLAKMKAKLETESNVKVKAKCPAKDCECDMKEVDFENVKIDVCEKCGGVWLDAGELNQILNKEQNEKGWFSKLFD